MKSPNKIFNLDEVRLAKFIMKAINMKLIKMRNNLPQKDNSIFE